MFLHSKLPPDLGQFFAKSRSKFGKSVVLNSVTLCMLELKEENSRDKIKLAAGLWVSLVGVHCIVLAVCDVNRFPVSIILLGKYLLISVSEVDLFQEPQESLQWAS